MGTFDNLYDLLEIVKSQGVNYYLVVIDSEDGKEKLHVFSSLDKNEKKKLLSTLLKKNE